MKKIATKLVKANNGFGMNEILGIAAAIIIAAFVIVPGLRAFAEQVISRLGSWWVGIQDAIFATR